MPIIEVNHITKEYRLGQLQSLKHSLQRATAKLRGQAVPGRPLFKALDDVDFKMEAGETVYRRDDVSFSIEEAKVGGIIGANGANKNTTENRCLTPFDLKIVEVWYEDGRSHL